jgi:transposase InsO family protein
MTPKPWLKYRKGFGQPSPSFITFTDNAMSFTMKYSQHPDRKTTFTKRVEQDGRIHALIKKGKPWYNGCIERSNRTDNENCFNLIRFQSSDDRKYQHRLWEMHYNFQRTHQGLNYLTPDQIVKKQHPIWAFILGIT